MKTIKIMLSISAVTSSSLVQATGTHQHMHNSDGVNTQNSHWMAPVAEAARKNPVKMNEESLNQGKQLFQKNCASCHGVNADGKGPAGTMLNPKPANLRIMSGMHPDGDFAYKIREGRGQMPSWKNAFTDDQIWHLVNYIQALSYQPVSVESEDSVHGHTQDHTKEHIHSN